ncbi:MAG: hypothetical protein AAFZ09_11540, partial [Pseudomonadota bacterium]
MSTGTPRRAWSARRAALVSAQPSGAGERWGEGGRRSRLGPAGAACSLRGFAPAFAERPKKRSAVSATASATPIDRIVDPRFNGLQLGAAARMMTPIAAVSAVFCACSRKQA